MDNPLARCPYCDRMVWGYKLCGEWSTYPSCFCHTKADEMEKARDEYLRDEHDMEVIKEVR
jgi:hypothetical protein